MLGKFDIIGALINEKTKTGENLAAQIFSQLDISSLLVVRRVSRTWNQVLMQKKSIWIEKLRKAQPFLEDIAFSRWVCGVMEYLKIFPIFDNYIPFLYFSHNLKQGFQKYARY